MHVHSIDPHYSTSCTLKEPWSCRRSHCWHLTFGLNRLWPLLFVNLKVVSIISYQFIFILTSNTFGWASMVKLILVKLCLRWLRFLELADASCEIFAVLRSLWEYMRLILSVFRLLLIIFLGRGYFGVRWNILFNP